MEAELDSRAYPLGIAVSKEHLTRLAVDHHAERGAWNYTISPRGPFTTATPMASVPDRTRREALAILSDPELTGMRPEALKALTEQLIPHLEASREEHLHRQRGAACGRSEVMAAPCSPVPTRSW